LPPQLQIIGHAAPVSGLHRIVMSVAMPCGTQSVSSGDAFAGRCFRRRGGRIIRPQSSFAGPDGPDGPGLSVQPSASGRTGPNSSDNPGSPAMTVRHCGEHRPAASVAGAPHRFLQWCNDRVSPDPDAGPLSVMVKPNRWVTESRCRPLGRQFRARSVTTRRIRAWIGRERNWFDRWGIRAEGPRES
jgi:hypothetical protein